MKKKTWKKTIIFTVLLAVVVYLLRDELTEAVWEMRHIRIEQAVAVLLLSLVYQLAEGVNLTAVVRRLDARFPAREGFFGMLYTSFFRVVTFGSAPAAATAVYLNGHGIEAATGTGVSAILYVVHKSVIALVCLICLGLRWNSLRSLYREYFSYLLLSLVLIAVIAGFLLWLCFGEHLHTWLLALAHRLDRKGRLAAWLDGLEAQLGGLRTFGKLVMKDRKLLVELALWNMLKMFCWYLIPAVLLKGALPVGTADAVAVMAFVTVIAGVIPAPAGIGSTEFAFLLLFSGMASQTQLLSCALVYRFVTYLLPGILGAGPVLREILKKNNRTRKGIR